MAGNGLDVDPEVLDAASAEIAAVVDDHDGHRVELGGGDYGHTGLAAAAGTFVEQVDLATAQLVMTIDVLAGELTTQAAAYRSVDEQVCTTFSGTLPGQGGAPFLDPGRAPAPLLAPVPPSSPFLSAPGETR